MSQTIASIDNPITWTVHYKQNWTDSWSENDVHLVPTNVQFALAPTIPRATIIRNFGNVKRLGISDSIVTPLDLTGKFIKITLSQVDEDGDAATKNWYGYCPDPTDQYEGTRYDSDFGQEVSTGLTTYNCYGLEWFLRDTVIKTCIAQESGGSVRDIVHKRVIPFNFTNGDRYGRVQGNMSTNENSKGIYEFTPDDNAETWMGQDVVKHLLEVWYRQTGSVFKFDLDYAYIADQLNNIEGAWDFDGQNFHSAIFGIIGPSNAFSFLVTVDETASPNVATIVAYPTVSEDVEDEDSNVIVSALPNKYFMNLDSDSRIADGGVNIKYLSSNHYDQIEVRGDWLRVAFTMATGDDASAPYTWPRILKEGWSSADQVAYEDGSDDKRRTEEFTSVYKRFIVDSAWDKTTGPNSATEALPAIDPSTGQISDTISQQNFFQKNRIFDRTLPWSEIDNESQPRAPFICIFDDDGKWYMLDNPSDEKTGLGFQMLDDQLGIKINTGNKLNHITAMYDFDGTSDESPEWDYNNIFATVSLQTDERARIVIDSPDSEPGEINRVKVINMPQFAVWWICPNTVKSIDPETLGYPGLVLSGATGEYARDDSDKLLRSAILARELYGRKRQILNIDYISPLLDDMIGSFVDEVQAGQTTESINTIISDVTYRLEANAQRQVLKTSFFEFDLNRILRRRGSAPTGGNSFGMSNDELANIPVRQSSTSSAGGSDPYYFGASIKDATTVSIARGVYRRSTGWAETAKTDVTVTGTGYISLTIKYDPDYTSNGGLRNTFEFSTDHPAQYDPADFRVFREEICKVTVISDGEDTTITAVEQIWPGGVIGINGRAV